MISLHMIHSYDQPHSPRGNHMTKKHSPRGDPMAKPHGRVVLAGPFPVQQLCTREERRRPSDYEQFQLRNLSAHSLVRCRRTRADPSRRCVPCPRTTGPCASASRRCSSTRADPDTHRNHVHDIMTIMPVLLCTHAHAQRSPRCCRWGSGPA